MIYCAVHPQSYLSFSRTDRLWVLFYFSTINSDFYKDHEQVCVFLKGCKMCILSKIDDTILSVFYTSHYYKVKSIGSIKVRTLFLELCLYLIIVLKGFLDQIHD